MDRTQLIGIALLVCLALPGCGRPQAALPPAKAAEVVVMRPVVKQVTDFEDFTGRTEAVASVEVRARVTGYLDKVLFKEGTEVKQGDPLFEIDPRTYRAEFQRAEATLLQAQAHLGRLQLDYKRAVPLLPSQAISREDFDKIAGDRDEAQAAVKLAEAARDLAQLNVEFTRVIAPIGGRISRQLIDPGNMVKADETPLTTIVTMDPIYVYFDEDERTLLRIRRMIRAGKMKSAREGTVPVFLGLVDEEGYSHEGTLNFIDNRVDAMTGTLRLRALFPNPNRLFSPGLFARIRVPIGSPHAAVLVSEQALGSDQGQKFVYVVNDKEEVESRAVKAGPLQDGLRVIEEGLNPNERVVVSGLQRVRAGAKVECKLVAGAKPAETPAQTQTPAQTPAQTQTPAETQTPSTQAPPRRTPAAAEAGAPAASGSGASPAASAKK